MRRKGPRFAFSPLNAVLGFDFFLVFEFWWSFFRGQSYPFATFRHRGKRNGCVALCMRTNILDEKFFFLG